MNNIFENVEFGDKFLTNDGKRATYVGYRNSYFPREKRYVKVLQFISEDYVLDKDNGHYVRCEEYDERFPEECKIVSRYTKSSEKYIQWLRLHLDHWKPYTVDNQVMSFTGFLKQFKQAMEE